MVFYNIENEIEKFCDIKIKQCWFTSSQEIPINRSSDVSNIFCVLVMLAALHFYHNCRNTLFPKKSFQLQPKRVAVVEVGANCRHNLAKLVKKVWKPWQNNVRMNERIWFFCRWHKHKKSTKNNYFDISSVPKPILRKTSLIHW